MDDREVLREKRLLWLLISGIPSLGQRRSCQIVALRYRLQAYRSYRILSDEVGLTVRFGV